MPNAQFFSLQKSFHPIAQYPPPPILAAVNIFANPLIEGVYNKALAANNLHFLQQAMARKKGVHPTAGISITVWWGGGVGGRSRGGWGINGALLKVVRKYFTSFLIQNSVIILKCLVLYNYYYYFGQTNGIFTSKHTGMCHLSFQLYYQLFLVCRA